MAKLATLRSEVVATACTGFSHAEVHRLVEQLETIKDNVRDALQTAPTATKLTKLKERRYG
jgi:MarR family transcriptional regulator for hemolysin